MNSCKVYYTSQVRLPNLSVSFMLKQLHNLINHGIREIYNAVLMVLDGQSSEHNTQCQGLKGNQILVIYTNHSSGYHQISQFMSSEKSA